MAESYDMTTSVKVIKSSNKEVVVEESSFYNNLAFGLMVEKAAEYYTLVTKLQKK